VYGAGCSGGPRTALAGAIYRLWGRSWHSAAVSVFTHVTGGAAASNSRELSMWCWC
jgi:hypothetical protein